MSETIIPRHVGLILDGNRRWAKDRGLPTLEGHRKGADNLREIAEDFFNKGVSVVSAYVFSTENWKRSEKEVGYLMKLTTKFLDDFLKDAIENDVRIVVMGSRQNLSDSVLKAIEKAEKETLQNEKHTLALCLNYGGRQEIIDAVKFIIDGNIDSDCIDEPTFHQYLYGDNTIGDVDIVVRTSGEQRLSGFMTWRTVYSELMFIDKHWPDFDETDVDAVLEEYISRQRRFGS